MSSSSDFRMVAKTFFGLEDVLCAELLKLGAKNIKKGVRNVSFVGDKGFLYKCNLSLRTAIKILKPITAFKIKTNKELYSSFNNFPWEKYISVESSFSIESVLISEFFSHSLFFSQKAKDGIVDRFRKLYKKRPNIDSINPEIKLNLHLRNNICTVSLDSSGNPLNQRGYRLQTNIAPINEVLAAGIIQLSGWKFDCDFLDPMCGSGTFLIEAAMIAINYPPNLQRNHFLFKNWKDFDPKLFEIIKKSISSKISSLDVKIYGYDNSLASVEKSIINIKKAGLENKIIVKKNDFFVTNKEHNNKLQIIFNPPYGERIPIDFNSFYKRIGDTLKQNYTNSVACIITSNLEALKHVGLRHKRRIKLFNGKLESRMVSYEIYEGSKKNKY